jgi:hypothetical protein
MDFMGNTMLQNMIYRQHRDSKNPTKFEVSILGTKATFKCTDPATAQPFEKTLDLKPGGAGARDTIKLTLSIY